MPGLRTDSERRMLVDQALTAISPFAKEIYPAANVEATKESYEDGHVRISPSAGLSERQIGELQKKIADRSGDMLAETGVFLRSAVHDPDTGGALERAQGSLLCGRLTGRSGHTDAGAQSSRIGFAHGQALRRDLIAHSWEACCRMPPT